MIFSNIKDGIVEGINNWEDILLNLTDKILINNKNNQGRTIKQILGHMVDSVSNNTHRIIHLQYQKSPLSFPNYASNGNNDKWIAIQNYQNEDWHNLVKHWKYSHIHFIHLISNLDESKLKNVWISNSIGERITLEEMVNDFLRHFNLHLNEIEELIN